MIRVGKSQCQWITEYRGCFLEGYAVLGKIAVCLGFVPFEFQHVLCLQVV